ncbi:glycosyltransferase family 4 protein [Thauera sinica]|uniref:Glycosyltransferase family 4 protein n=1 Tax=Thauera sinica TaxID=2665146 RepID=A0ABW1APG8_9RHOO|nr:glycosyltransferase family 4 protein [Thauera sp. K11]ATE62295.1 glycosyl transferase [Thauera sp. K11]
MHPQSPQALVYVGRSRLHRNRANLIQALHVAEGFRNIGLPMRMYLPPAEGCDVRRVLEDFGVSPDLDIRPTQWLHTRFRLWPFFLRFRRELRAARSVFTPLPQVSGILAALGIPHVLEIHDAERDLIAKGMLDTVISAHRKGVLTRLLPVSRGAERLLLDSGADPARVTVAPNGVELGAYQALPAFDPARLAAPRLVYLGTLERKRGIEVFGAAAAAGLGQVTLIGNKAPGYTPPPGVVVLPFVPHHEVPGWYGRTDIVLLPYPKDIATADSMSPMKLFEALAAGRPIVASNLPVLRELLTHEENALLVDADDADAWLAAIRRLQADPRLAATLAGNARELASRFTWEKRAADIARACGWLPAA